MAGYFAKCGYKKRKGTNRIVKLSELATAEERREALAKATVAEQQLAYENGSFDFSCGKKAGHHLSKSREQRKHVDNKQTPVHYWESCTWPDCEEPIDPHSEYNSKDGVEPTDYKCDEHWLDEFDRITELARKGIY